MRPRVVFIFFKVSESNFENCSFICKLVYFKNCWHKGVSCSTCTLERLNKIVILGLLGENRLYKPMNATITEHSLGM